MARSGQTRARPRWSRGRIVLNIAAVIAGGAFGTVLALRSEPAISGEAPAPAAPAPPSAPSSAAAPGAAMPEVTPPAGSPPPASPPPDLHAALVAQIKDALSRFVAWSHSHAGARCPDAAALGGAALDPWGHPLRIVCADQPADQIAGVLSFGPDGVPGTGDDVVSWTLGPDVTDLVRGPRWSARRGTARATPAASPATSAPPPGKPGAGSNDTDGEGIPNRR